MSIPAGIFPRSPIAPGGGLNNQTKPYFLSFSRGRRTGQNKSPCFLSRVVVSGLQRIATRTRPKRVAFLRFPTWKSNFFHASSPHGVGWLVVLNVGRASLLGLPRPVNGPGHIGVAFRRVIRDCSPAGRRGVVSVDTSTTGTPSECKGNNIS